MNAAALVPTPDAIPVPWGWFYILLMVTFLLHLLVMNAMLGGGIIALISSFQSNEQGTRLPREFSYKWPYTIAFAVNMGVAPLLFVQVLYGQFIYSSSILMASFWLSVIALLILAYYTAYLYDFKFEQLSGLRIFVLEVAVFLLLLIAFLFTNNMTLMIAPQQWPGYFDQAGRPFLNFADPTLVPRYLHFVTGAVAIAGLYLALIGHFRFIKSGIEKEILIATGMGFFFKATVVQMVLGIWFLMALPSPVMLQFMGGSGYGTVLLVAGIVLALVSLHFAYRKRLMATCSSALLLLLVMILMRDLVRIESLKPYFQLADLSVRPEYSPLIFFLIVFAAGLAMIAYMLKLAFNCRKEVAK